CLSTSCIQPHSLQSSRGDRMSKFVAVLFLTLAANAQSYKFARAWDGEKLIPNAVITIDHDRIKSISSSGPANAIDMTRYTALRGLIDVHTHMTYVFDMNRISPSGRGAATVRNLGASDYADIALRDLINAGLMPGPRMYVSGYGLQITRGGRGGGPQTADGPAEVMKVVRQQVGAGDDVIKMYGSTGSGQDVTGFQTFTYEEMKAAVDTAHALGKTIAIHTYGPTGARDAVRAGADSIEHATDMDDATIVEMARKKL